MILRHNRTKRTAIPPSKSLARKAAGYAALLEGAGCRVKARAASPGRVVLTVSPPAREASHLVKTCQFDTRRR